jgi:hypothetical protein
VITPHKRKQKKTTKAQITKSQKIKMKKKINFKKGYIGKKNLSQSELSRLTNDMQYETKIKKLIFFYKKPRKKTEVKSLKKT